MSCSRPIRTSRSSRRSSACPEPFIGISWPAEPNAAIDAIRPPGIVEQAVGNVIAGRMTPDEAVADAHQKMVDLFEEGGIPQDG